MREKPLSLERAKRAEKPKRGGRTPLAGRRADSSKGEQAGADLGCSLGSDGKAGKAARRFVGARRPSAGPDPRVLVVTPAASRGDAQAHELHRTAKGPRGTAETVLRDRNGGERPRPIAKRSTAGKAREWGAQQAARRPSGRREVQLGDGSSDPRNPATAKDREGASNQIRRNELM